MAVIKQFKTGWMNTNPFLLRIFSFYQIQKSQYGILFFPVIFISIKSYLAILFSMSSFSVFPQTISA